MERKTSSPDPADPLPSARLAGPATTSIESTFVIARAGREEPRVAQVAPGTTLRHALRSIGLFGEGCTVLSGGRPVPLDTPIVAAQRWTVVPAFSGG